MSQKIQQKKQKNKRSSYKKITEYVRTKLIQRVIKNEQNIKKVVNEMNINISTAKAIIKVYQQEERIGKKKKRDKIINVIQTFSFYSVDGNNIEKLSDTVIEEKKKTLQNVQSKQIQYQLKQESKQRANQLIGEVMQRYRNIINNNIQSSSSPNILQSMTHNQNNTYFYPYCTNNLQFYNMPFK